MIEATTILVDSLNITFQNYFPSFDQCFEEKGCLVSKGVFLFRGIVADNPDRFLLPVDSHFDGVSVDHSGNYTLDRLTLWGRKLNSLSSNQTNQEAQN